MLKCVSQECGPDLPPNAYLLSVLFWKSKTTPSNWRSRILDTEAQQFFNVLRGINYSESVLWCVCSRANGLEKFPHAKVRRRRGKTYEWGLSCALIRSVRFRSLLLASGHTSKWKTQIWQRHDSIVVSRRFRAYIFLQGILQDSRQRKHQVPGLGRLVESSSFLWVNFAVSLMSSK